MRTDTETASTQEIPRNASLLKLVRKGILDGSKGSIGIIKIMLPVSFVVKVLSFYGLVTWLSNALSPYFRYIGLQGDAILALLSGYLINCYSAIAVMSTLTLSTKQVTILSAMLLICHTLPIELAVQKKAGGSLPQIFVVRVFSSLLTGFILNAVMNDNGGTAHKLQAAAANQAADLRQAVISWLWDSTTVIQLILVNILIMIVYQLLERFHVLVKISKLSQHIMFLFGLPKKTAFLWLVANLIGLLFGAGMLLEAKANKTLDEASLKKLNLSIAPCHSLIQETSNFLVLGASLPFLILPRLLIAIISVWLYNLYLHVTGSFSLKDENAKVLG